MGYANPFIQDILASNSSRIHSHSKGNIMYTKKDMEQMLYGLLEDLVSKEQPKIIEESKEEPLTEYQKELLQSLQPINEAVARLNFNPEQMKKIFPTDQSNANLRERLEFLTMFVSSNNPVDGGSDPARSILVIDILSQVRDVLAAYEPSSAGFEMEHLLATICSGNVIETDIGNKKKEIVDGFSAGDVTDVVSGNKTAYSLKTIKKGEFGGSIPNFIGTVIKSVLGKYSAFYYVVIEKSEGMVQFKEVEIVGNKKINVENIKSLVSNLQDDQINALQNAKPIDLDGLKLSGKTGTVVPIGPPFIFKDINKIIKSHSNTFTDNIRQIRENLKEVENRMVSFIANSIESNNSEEAREDIGVASKLTQDSQQRMLGLSKGEGAK